jgi:hypothetical protein
LDSPEEFADGLAEGAQLLMGHLSGGISSNASLITTVGNATLPLNFDEDYKKVCVTVKKITVKY